MRIFIIFANCQNSKHRKTENYDLSRTDPEITASLGTNSNQLSFSSPVQTCRWIPARKLQLETGTLDLPNSLYLIKYTETGACKYIFPEKDYLDQVI